MAQAVGDSRRGGAGDAERRQMLGLPRSLCQVEVGRAKGLGCPAGAVTVKVSAQQEGKSRQKPPL